MLRAIDHPVDRLVMIHNVDSNGETNQAVDELLEKIEKGTFDYGHSHVRNVVTHHHAGNLGFRFV